METTIRISWHRNGNSQHFGSVTIEGHYTELEIDAIANETDGLANLVAMGEWTGPENYEWTGDEVYEIMSRQEFERIQSQNRAMGLYGPHDL